MVGPAAKRAVVKDLAKRGQCSERKGCDLVEAARSTVRYERRIKGDEAALRKRIHRLADKLQAIRFSADSGAFETGGLAGEQETGPSALEGRGFAAETKSQEATGLRADGGPSCEGGVSQPCVEL